MDPSAAHLARIAAATGRRQHEVIVFLAGTSICHESLGRCRATIERMRSAGASLLVHSDLLCELGLPDDEIGLPEADDQALAALLLTPGIRAHWC